MVALSNKGLTVEFQPAPLTVTPREKLLARQAIDELVQETTRSCYPSASLLPYHGQGHPQLVWNNARKLIERAKRFGVDVNEHAVRDAVALHDVFSQITPQLLGFKNAEHLASHFAYNFLRQHGSTEDHARLVERVIVASNPFANPALPEEIIMRAADLGNLLDEYTEFRSASLAFHREMELKAGHSIAWESHIPQCYQYLSIFLWRMLTLTPNAYDDAGRSHFHMHALENLARFARDQLSSQEIKMVAELVTEGGAISKLQGEPNVSVFHIALNPKSAVREQILSNILNNGKPAQLSSIPFVVYGKATAIPISDGSLDEVILHSDYDGSFSEARRALKYDGCVSITLQDGSSEETQREIARQATNNGFELQTAKIEHERVHLRFKRIDQVKVNSKQVNG